MKRAIPTVKAEALENHQFELTFIPYAKYPKRNGIVTQVEVAPIPTGSIFRFSTYQEDEQYMELIDVSYQTVSGIYPCDCPKDDNRIFLFKGNMDDMLRRGDAEYLDVPERKPQTEEEVMEEAEAINKELDERLADLAEDQSTEEIEEAEAINKELDERLADLAEDQSTEEIEEAEAIDTTEDDSEEEEDGADESGDFDFDESDDEDEDEDEYDDADDDSEGKEAIDVGEMSPEEIRRRLNQHYQNSEEAEEEPEAEDEEEPEAEPEKAEEPKTEEKPNGRFIGAPENLSSHKEPYNNAKKKEKKEKYDKKRDWENKNRDSRKNDKKKDKKKARREAIADATNQIDFSAIVSNAFGNKN